MGFRTVYGNTISENGWPMVDEGSCTWVDIPGCDVSLEIQNGQPLQIMRAFAADFNAYVEPLRDADSACWTATNSVDTSNHLSGTAMDLNWNSHPFQVANAGFDAAKLARVRELLDFYEGTIYWGNDWTTPKDAMHFQMGYDTYKNAHTADFINRKIRADGYSTFERAAAPDGAAVLAQATGLSSARAAAILPEVVDGLTAAQCTNVKRIAMWLAQVGHESDNFNATEEYANGDMTQERWIYKGRTWIQLTWKSNYAGFSQWCFDRGLVPTATYFVDNPKALADLKWAGLGAAWYWTVARPQINGLCDAGDLVGVTQVINGGQNGIDDRRTRYNRALALGDALLTLTTTTTGDEDEMAGWTQASVDRAMLLLENIAGVRRQSLSPLRWPGEGDVNTCAGFAWSADANVHVLLVEKLAVEYGDTQSINLLYAVASNTDPARKGDAELALHILQKVDPVHLAQTNAAIQKWLDAETKAAS